MTTRRKFLATLFIAGLMTQLGLRGADVAVQKYQAAAVFWLGPNGWAPCPFPLYYPLQPRQ